MRRWIPLLATCLLLPCLIGLGLWQLDRSAQKLEKRELMAARALTTPTELDGSNETADALAFRSVSATGKYVPQGQILIDNQIHRGQAGYHVVTPLLLAQDGRTVLVNRGWVPWGNDRNVLPDTPVPAGSVTVTGRAVVPQEYFELQAPAAKSAGPVWQNLDLTRYQQTFGGTLVPAVVELSESGGEGFVRSWRTRDDGWVERHRGYAFQWFALAVTLVIINLVLWRRAKKIA